MTQQHQDTGLSGKDGIPVASRNPKWNRFYDTARDVLFGCRIYLSDAEEKVASFIFQRTRMYGKDWETIPLRHFTDGVWSQKGGMSCSRLPMKAATVIQAIRHLK